MNRYIMAEYMEKPKKRQGEELKDRQNMYKQITMKVRTDSELYQAMVLCQKITGFPLATYAQLALAEKLKRDGYLAEQGSMAEITPETTKEKHTKSKANQKRVKKG